MKFLFVLENLSARCGANVNIVMTLLRHLNNNNEVHVLTKYGASRAIDEEKGARFATVRAFDFDQVGYVTAFQEKRQWRKLSSIKRFLLLLTHPRVLLYMLDAKYGFSFSKRRFQKELEAVCRAEAFDAVIGVAAPYYIARAVADANISCKKTVIQLDPYTYNYTLPAWQIRHRARCEIRTIDKLDLLFAVSFVRDEIREKNIYSKLDKVVSFELPGIVDAPDRGDKDDAQQRADDRIHFVFAGQFYEAIRNPEYLLSLFTHLPSNYVLDIVGGGTPGILEKYKNLLGDRLILHGWVSGEEAKQKVQEADVLVNLNNTIPNQLASKLFDYISTGKPILNICKRKECLSLKYTKQYSSCLDLFETGDVTPDLIDGIISFIDKTRGITVDHKTIMSTFFENTDSYVSLLLSNKIEHLLAIRN